MSGVEAVAWCGVEDGEVVALSFKHNEASDCVEPLYSRHAIDTLRAQLEAAELRDAQMRDAAKLLLARAEAAEADSGRLDWIVSQWHQPNSPALAAVVEAFRTGDSAIVRSAIDAARTKEQQA